MELEDLLTEYRDSYNKYKQLKEKIPEDFGKYVWKVYNSLYSRMEKINSAIQSFNDERINVGEFYEGLNLNPKDVNEALNEILKFEGMLLLGRLKEYYDSTEYTEVKHKKPKFEHFRDKFILYLKKYAFKFPEESDTEFYETINVFGANTILWYKGMIKQIVEKFVEDERKSDIDLHYLSQLKEYTALDAKVKKLFNELITNNDFLEIIVKQDILDEIILDKAPHVEEGIGSKVIPSAERFAGKLQVSYDLTGTLDVIYTGTEPIPVRDSVDVRLFGLSIYFVKNLISFDSVSKYYNDLYGDMVFERFKVIYNFVRKNKNKIEVIE